MEEPLLGRSCSGLKIPAASADHRLFHIPEASPILSKSVPIAVKDLNYKERIVYGSLESPTSSLHFLFDPQSTGDTATGSTNGLSIGNSQGAIRNSVDPLEIQENNEEIHQKSDPEAKEGISQRRDDDRLSLRLPIVCDPDHQAAATHPIKKAFHRSVTAPAVAVKFETKEKSQYKPQFKSVSPIALRAILGLIVYLIVGVLIYLWKRNDFSGFTTHPLVDGLYFCIVTLCTIGYGDIAPISATSKLFSCAFVLVGFGFVDILLSAMVNFVLEKQETLLISAIEGSHHETAMKILVNTKKGRMRIRMRVAFAILVVFTCLVVGTLVMHWLESLSWLDSFYLACMSVTTVGYGDHTFQTMPGRLFAAVWLLVSTLAVARAFLFFAEARIDRRNRSIAKWVLHRQMTLADLVAADMDNNGFLTKSEFVVYKLKEMGKITEKEIREICEQFNSLDTDNTGRITLSDLMNS